MLVVRIWGGLGNQMFQYAYARALKERTGQKVYIDTKGVFKEKLEGGRRRDYSLDCFCISLLPAERTAKEFYFLNRGNPLERFAYEMSVRHMVFPWYYMESNEGFQPELLDVQGDMYLQGWFQNEKYFREYRNLICEEFTPVREIKIEKGIQELIENEVTVSVHIRRGDYKSIDYTVPLDYYQKAINHISKKANKPFFLFFSDDIEWVRENMKLPDKHYFVSGKNLKDYEEMMLMSRCAHNIIANSTFSWWGAWLNKNPDKIVVAPRMWMRLKDPLSIVPEEWIVI